MPAFVYLASASPRRRELLRQIGVSYRRLPVAVDETPLAGESPHAYVSRLALLKAQTGLQTLSQSQRHPVLGADTAVILDGTILGKPGDRTEGLAMLARLSGREHQVLTAVALATKARIAVKMQQSRPPTGTPVNRATRPGVMRFKAGRQPLSPNCTAATPGLWVCRYLKPLNCCGSSAFTFSEWN